MTQVTVPGINGTFSKLGKTNPQGNQAQNLLKNVKNNSKNSPAHFQVVSPLSPVKGATKEQFYKRVLIVDDNPDITLTFKSGLEGYYDTDKMRFEVYTYNDPLLALTQFKPHFYDLLLIDINMPDMNGFELCQKILELDINVRVCFISAAELNIEALREVYPTLSLGCFIKKPVSIEHLVKRLSAELH